MMMNTVVPAKASNAAAAPAKATGAVIPAKTGKAVVPAKAGRAVIPAKAGTHTEHPTPVHAMKPTRDLLHAGCGPAVPARAPKAVVPAKASNAAAAVPARAQKTVVPAKAGTHTEQPKPMHAPKPPRHLLHVGCGPIRSDRLPVCFRSDAWQEIRLDIDPRVQPDIVGTITDLSMIPDNSVDAIWSSHNL
ncbi:MAG: hypothetical protein ACXW3B_18395, partial [Telluria sp.]